MLRQARSLPSLRLLAQEQAATMTRGQQMQMTSARSKFMGFFKREVHSTPKKDAILLNMNNNSRYSSMNCQGLKMECRRRGLKVSGRKLELIQRLSRADESQMLKSNTRNFGTIPEPTPAKPAKKTVKKSRRKLSTAVKHTTKSKATAKSASVRTFTETASKAAKDDTSKIEFYKPPPPVKKQIDHINLSEFGAPKKAGDAVKAAEPAEEESGGRDFVIFGISAAAIYGWWSSKDF